MVLIRNALADDAAAIARVHVASWQSTYAGMLPASYLSRMSLGSAEARWRGSLPDGGPGRGTLVAVNDHGEIVGFVSVGPQRHERRGIDGFAGEIYALYLHDDAKGSGVGRLLMAAGAERMLAAGVRSALVWCLAPNPTRWFYERLGGVWIADRPGRFAGTDIVEVAYGWHDLVPLAGQSAVG